MRDLELFRMSTEEKLNQINFEEAEKTLYYISLLGMEKKELLLAFK